MPNKTPLTFEQAMTRAESFVSHKKKLPWLLDRAVRKAEKHYESLLASWESFHIFIRLIREWLAGAYSAPGPSIVMAVAAVFYFVSPLDLIPDATPVLGLVDDVLMINSAARKNLRVISNFRNWEVSFR